MPDNCIESEPIEWIDGEHTLECPVVHIGEFITVFRAINWISKGVLPNAGGWADQPAKLIEFIEIAEGVQWQKKSK